MSRNIEYKGTFFKFNILFSKVILTITAAN